MKHSLISLVQENLDNSKYYPFKEIQETDTYNWVNDNIITKCNDCMKDFNMSRRKHHCRRCGNIFCYKCSNYYIDIPNYIMKASCPHTSYFHSKESRVCRYCYHNIDEIQQLHEIIDFFNIIPLTLTEYYNIKFVCKTWYKISKIYTNKMKKMLFYFPDRVYTQNEINMLRLNRFLLSGHSKWMIQLILSQPWGNLSNNYTKSLLKIIDKHKKTSCNLLCCQGDCSETFKISDIIIILTRKIKYYPIIKHLLDILTNKIHTEEDEFQCYIYLFIDIMLSYKESTRLLDLIQLFLINICSKRKSYINQLFWLLTYHIDYSEDRTLKQFRIRFIDSLDKDFYNLIKNSYYFTQNIIKTIDNNDLDNIQKLVAFLRDFSFEDKDYLLPVHTQGFLEEIKYDNIQILSSKTRPILLPCVINKKQTNILLKNEDIRKEFIIMNIIKLINIFLLVEESLDLKIITYDILPISNKYGFIEFVPDSKTLYYIKEELKFSIQNWIIEKNNLQELPNIRDNICRSCAAYCVITYLFGIGDRHLDNIMITDDGKLFHIDFGYILGKDPKLMSPDIRLTPEMIDAMGGVHSKSYINFKIYCSKAFNCIRRHSKLFYIMLCDIYNIPNQRVTSTFIKEYIDMRFVPGENYEEALRRIQEKIDIHSGVNSYTETIIDYFHKKYKTTSSGSTPRPSSKTTNSKSLLNKAKGYGKSTKNMMSSFYNYFQK